jgi:hypothetical protein
MERTTPAGNRLPDIIVHNTPDNFTKVPNDTIRNPKMSWKAKGILTLILSNKQGWFSFKKTIQKYGTDGVLSIESGLRELEQNGYLIRLRYRKAGDPTKRIQGSTWICVDMANAFDWKRIRRRLKKYGMEPFNKEFQEPEKPDIENPGSGEPSVRGTVSQGNKRLKRLIIKKTNYKEDQKEKKDFSDSDWILNLFPQEWKNDKSFQESIRDFIQHRKEKGSKLTKVAASRLAKKLTKYSIQEATQALELSMENGWQGVFPESITNNSASKKPSFGTHTLQSREVTNNISYPTGEIYDPEKKPQKDR